MAVLMTNNGAFIQTAQQQMRKGMRSIAMDLLKEFYMGETWAVKKYKAGHLTDLEIILYDREIQYWKEHQNMLKDLVYTENPLLKLIKPTK